MRVRRPTFAFIFLFLACTALSPAARADDLEELVTNMARVSACWSPSFSPDGKEMALVSFLSGIPQVYTIDSQGGWPKLVTTLKDSVGGAVWSPDGKWIAFGAATQGGLSSHIYLIHPDGTGMIQITDGENQTNWLGQWSPDSQVFTFASSRLQPGSMDIFAYDIATKKIRLVSKSSGVSDVIDMSQDGKRLIIERVDFRGDDNLYMIDMKTGKETLLTPHTPPGSFPYGYFSPDGSTIYLATNKDREFIALGRVKLDAAGNPGPIEVIAARDNADLLEFGVTPDGKLAFLNWNVGGLSEVDRLDLQTLKISPAFKSPTEVVANFRFSRDSRQMALAIFGSASPPDLAVLDIPTGKLKQVTYSAHAGVDLSTLVRPELVQYKGEDGLPLSGWLYRPPGRTGPLPTVVILHGGPEEQERPTFLGTYQGLVKRGIAVFAPNVRGSSGFGKTFVNLDNGALRVNAVKDVKSSVDYLVREGISEPKHIGVFGFSYGGYLTMASITEYPDLFAAAVDLSGVVNFETFFEHTEAWMAAISTVEYGDPATQRDLLRKLSPLHRIDRVKVPVLVIHGANDTNVPVLEAEQIVDNLKRRGVPVQFLLFPDEGHGFTKEVNRIRSSVSIVRWFEGYLKEGKAPALLATDRAGKEKTGSN